MTIKDFIERVGVYFNLMPDKEDEQRIVAQITEGVSFKDPTSGLRPRKSLYRDCKLHKGFHEARNEVRILFS